VDSPVPEALTWTGLLAQWVRFAQASLALPDDADGSGSRWRASVPAIINLQAVTFALADLDRLAADELALALDKAEILISDNERLLAAIWNAGMTPSLREICDDARATLDAAKHRRRSARATSSRVDQTSMRHHRA
jgi:hypothetical protein